MSELVPSVLPLDKGLDLQTAKIIAPPGSVLDSLNYEQVDFQGQKRIDGYTRYDGSVLSAFDDYALIEFATPEPFDGVPTDTSYPVTINDELWGVSLAPYGASGNGAYVAVINYNIIPQPGDSVGFNQTNVGAITSYATGLTSGVSAEAHYDKLLELMSALRSRVEHLPGPIAGLHWFQDRLYAVASLQLLEVDVNEPDVFINTTVEAGSKTGQVVDQEFSTFTVLSTDEFAEGDELYTDDGQLIGVVLSTSVNGDATFYESRSEAQAIAEDGVSTPDYGWRAKHLGWQVNYAEGIALYGTLAALNQNRQNVGIQGPTDISGTNGSPAVLTQKVAITNAPTQVNGWKSYDSPTSYVLDARDVQLDDVAFVYADAFVSWSSDSSIVLTPGSDMQGLVEYAPTASVTYEPF